MAFSCLPNVTLGFPILFQSAGIHDTSSVAQPCQSATPLAPTCSREKTVHLLEGRERFGVCVSTSRWIDGDTEIMLQVEGELRVPDDEIPVSFVKAIELVHLCPRQPSHQGSCNDFEARPVGFVRNMELPVFATVRLPE